MSASTGRLAGKVAIVTGGAMGQGAGISRAYVAEGAKVVIADVAKDEGQALADELGESAHFAHHDVGDEAAWTSLVADTNERFGLVGVLANNAGTYLGQDGQDDLWAVLDARSAVVFIHPADLPGPTVPDVLPFAADFLLDTTRAAYLLVRNGIRRRYPNIKFILSHAGGFVPYASHRMAVAIMGDTGRSAADSLDDFSSFYFDTALSSSSAALPTLLAFAEPGHVTFGSDWPFAPIAASKLFAAGLENYPLDPAARAAIDRTNALALFPRLGARSEPIRQSPVNRLRHNLSRTVMRGVAKLTNTD